MPSEPDNAVYLVAIVLTSPERKHMVRIIVLASCLCVHVDVYAQLLVPQSNGFKTSIASEVPKGLADGASVKFGHLDVYFDGGSYGAFFTRENGARLVLFFANPRYWSERAKKESKQVVAIQERNRLIEIKHGSPLERRLLELLAEDIVDNTLARDKALSLIRIRDCLLHREPLAEIIEDYDPKTWKYRLDRLGSYD